MKEINSKEKKEINGGKMSSLMKRKHDVGRFFLSFWPTSLVFLHQELPFLSLGD